MNKLTILAKQLRQNQTPQEQNEIDGGQHNTPENILTDAQRTQFLQSKGYKVIRFWNNEIDNNIEGVYLELENQYQEITK